MIVNGYEVCDRCQDKYADHELLGKEQNAYQLCEECAEKGLSLIDKFVKKEVS